MPEQFPASWTARFTSSGLGQPEEEYRVFSLPAKLMLGAVLLVLVIVCLAQKSTSMFRPFRSTLVSETLIVQPGQHRYAIFQVDQARLISARVVGLFEASGGFGNDIQVVLAEEGEFQNWINGHPARLLYSSPKTTTGKIDVAITEPGRYVLGFSNAFSLVSSKAVSAQVDLQYLIP